MSELPDGDPRPLDLRFAPAAALLGFAAAAWQVYLIRAFASQFHGSELTFSLVIAAWLLGGGLGGFWALRKPGPGSAGVPLIAAALPAAPLVFAALRCSRWILGTLPGEAVGPSPVLLFALAAGLLLNFPLGAAFVRLAGAFGGARTYLWESAGAAAGGACISLLLVPFIPDWTALGLIQMAVAAALFLLGRPKVRALAAAAALLGPLLVFVDRPLQKAVWRPFHLVAAQDGPYGRIQIIGEAGLFTVYDNGARAFSLPDPAAAEDAVHLPLLLHGAAKRVLLIGGALGGAVGEVLKYPVESVTTVEIDTRLPVLIRPYLDPAGRAALADPRVHPAASDGRVFLERSRERYDVIILALPDPSTVQFNRFYTVDFFRLVRSRLSPGGLFSFKAGASDNFMSPARRAYLSILRATLAAVFAATAVVPGDSAVFCASDRPLSAGADVLADRMRRRDIRTLTLTPEALGDRLHPLRVENFQSGLDAAAPVNSDERPIGYFFQQLLWSEQKKGPEARLLDLGSRVPPVVLLAVPLLLFLALLGRSLLRKRPGAAAAPALAFLGFSTIVIEVLAVVRYQALFGSFYSGAARLLTMMMAGLALGAWLGARGRMPAARLQAGLLALIILAFGTLSTRLPEPAFDLFLLGWGVVGGAFFVASARLFPRGAGGAGRAYAWDLLGSFAGAIVLTTLYIPRVGLAAITLGLGLGAAGILALLVFSRTRSALP